MGTVAPRRSSTTGARVVAVDAAVAGGSCGAALGASFCGQIGITGTACDGFRQEVIAYLWSVTRRAEKITYESYEPLKEAIEKKLMASVRDVSRIITKARTRDEEQSKKYGLMVEQLIKNGYPASCIDTILKYAANNLWKN